LEPWRPFAGRGQVVDDERAARAKQGVRVGAVFPGAFLAVRAAVQDKQVEGALAVDLPRPVR
jgi:hypothetical protein